MKWVKTAIIGLFCVLLVVLAGVGLVFTPTKVTAADDDFSSQWELPESVKQFVEPDGRGVRLFISSVYDGVDDGEYSGPLKYAKVRSFKMSAYDVGGDVILPDTDYIVGSDYFDGASVLLYFLWGFPEINPEGIYLPEEHRMFVYFDVEKQKFCRERIGLQYNEYWMSKYFDLLESGGGGDYQEGYEVGYQDGFIDGEKSKIAKNNEFFYNRIVIWIPAVITVVALASIISYLGLKKKE